MEENTINYFYVDMMLNAGNNNKEYDFNEATHTYLSNIAQAYDECVQRIQENNSIDNQIESYKFFMEYIHKNTGKIYRDTEQVIKNLERRKNVSNDDMEMDSAPNVLREDIFLIKKYLWE